MMRLRIKRRRRAGEGTETQKKAPITRQLALALNLTLTLIVAILAAVVSGAWAPPVHSAAARDAQGSATPAATTSQAPANVVPRFKPTSVPRGTFGSYMYSDPSGAHMTYYLYAPADYTPSGRYPLVLILHGGGEVALAKAALAKAALAKAAPVYNKNLVLNQDYVRAFTNVAAQEQWPSFGARPAGGRGQPLGERSCLGPLLHPRIPAKRIPRHGDDHPHLHPAGLSRHRPRSHLRHRHLHGRFRDMGGGGTVAQHLCGGYAHRWVRRSKCSRGADTYGDLGVPWHSRHNRACGWFTTNDQRNSRGWRWSVLHRVSRTRPRSVGSQKPA